MQEEYNIKFILSLYQYFKMSGGVWLSQTHKYMCLFGRFYYILLAKEKETLPTITEYL